MGVVGHGGGPGGLTGPQEQVVVDTLPELLLLSLDSTSITSTSFYNPSLDKFFFSNSISGKYSNLMLKVSPNTDDRQCHLQCPCYLLTLSSVFYWPVTSGHPNIASLFFEQQKGNQRWLSLGTFGPAAT